MASDGLTLVCRSSELDVYVRVTRLICRLEAA